MRTIARAPAYNLSFTAASLRPDLARIVAERYLATGEWVAAKESLLTSNALQARSGASAIRMERAFRQRLGTLTHSQILLVAQATAEDRAAICWLSACKHIPLAFAFASTVLREKVADRDPVLRPSDYEAFVEHESHEHPEISSLAPTSKRKIRQVLLLMLAEGGLLVSGSNLGTIHRPVLSPEVIRAITTDDPKWLAGFLVPDAEILHG